MIAQTVKGEAIVDDWCGTLATGSVVLTNLGAAAAEGTVEAIVAARTKLANGELHVFDTKNFTVKGEACTTAVIDGTYEAVSDGYFHESEYRSAPYFDLQIDGITLLDTKF